ncbi:MAG TPA: sigma-70 family RNA polymerase sigma factor [Solirubrobacteraceae bacterium]|nr:sigma-70 family RNA polymerase sigma factor [Solirubrobacteraceae bacterium]
MGHVGEVAELYARAAGLVRGQLINEVMAPEADIDDALQFAWIRFLHHRHRVGRDRAVSWLIATALHEVFKLLRRAGHDLSLEELMEGADDLHISRRAPAPEELVDPRLRLELLRELPERQERLIWLRGLGFNYPEMAAETGMTLRTVERQLIRGRRTLRRLDAVGD